MTHSPLPDEALLRSVAGGDSRAFEQLVERHETPLYRFAVRMCLDPERAQDAVQEALLSAWKDAAAFRGGSTVRTWLFSILMNACRHLRRTRAGQPVQSAPLDEALAAPSLAPTPEAQVGTAELGHLVDRVLSELDPQDREVLLLRDVEGLSGEDVARLLSLSLPAMKSRLHRARVALKTQLDRRLAGDGAARKVAACP